VTSQCCYIDWVENKNSDVEYTQKYLNDWVLSWAGMFIVESTRTISSVLNFLGYYLVYLLLIAEIQFLAVNLGVEIQFQCINFLIR